MVSLWFCKKSGCDSGITTTGVGCSAIGVVTVSGGRYLFTQSTQYLAFVQSVDGPYQLAPSIILERGLYPVVSQGQFALTTAALRWRSGLGAKSNSVCA